MRDRERTSALVRSVSVLAVAFVVLPRCTPLESGEDRFEEGSAGTGGAASGSGGAAGLGVGSGGVAGSNAGRGGATGGAAGEPRGGAGASSGDAGTGNAGGEGGSGDGACPALDARPVVRVGSESGEEELTGDVHFDCAHDYLLEGKVIVREDASLRIDAGTRLRAGAGALLLVMRGGRLLAEGTRELPIVMTSAAPAGERSPADWRGLVMIGDAPSHAANRPVYGTLNDLRAAYGGGPAGDEGGSCGMLRYVRIEFAGGGLDEAAMPGAGLTLAGCGSGTVVDHVQVHRSTDGVGLIGGNVPLSHVLVTNNSVGDCFEWTEGYRGTMQFIVGQSLGAGSGILGSNSEAELDKEPVSAPRIFNATLVGLAPLVVGSHYGLALQFGSLGSLKNAVIQGFADAAFDLRLPTETIAAELGPGRAIDISHVLMHGNAALYTPAAQVLSGALSMRQADPRVTGAVSRSDPSFVPSGSAVLIEVADVPMPFDTTAAYRGALPPSGSNWTSGWTAFPED